MLLDLLLFRRVTITPVNDRIAQPPKPSPEGNVINLSIESRIVGGDVHIAPQGKLHFFAPDCGEFGILRKGRCASIGPYGAALS